MSNIFRSVNHGCESIVHESLHGFSLLQCSREINEYPSLGLDLSDQLEISLELFLAARSTSPLALGRRCLPLCLRVSAGISSLKFGELFKDFFFFENVSFDFFEFGLLRSVVRLERKFKLLYEKVHKEGIVGDQASKVVRQVAAFADEFLDLVAYLLVLLGVKASVGVLRGRLLDLALGWGSFLGLVCGGRVGHGLRIDIVNDFLDKVVHSEDFDLARRILLRNLLRDGSFASASPAQQDQLEGQVVRDGP